MPKKNKFGGKKRHRVVGKIVEQLDDGTLVEKSFRPEDNFVDTSEVDFHKDASERYADEEDALDSDVERAIEDTAPNEDVYMPVQDKEAVYDFEDDEDDDTVELENRLKQFQSEMSRKYGRQNLYSDSEDEEVEQSAEKEKPESSNVASASVRSWGKDSRKFYGADVDGGVHFDVDSEDEDVADAKLEEEQALLLQKHMVSQIAEADYDLGLFKPKDLSDGMENVTNVTSKSEMSRKEKKQFLKANYPELPNLLRDYKEQLQQYTKELAPILSLHEKGILPDSKGMELLKFKKKLLLCYCSCIQFYLLLRAEDQAVEGHPVIQRMVQYKRLLADVTVAEESFRSEMNYLLREIRKGREASIQAVSVPKKMNNKSVSIVLPKVEPSKVSREGKSISQLLDEDDGEPEDDLQTAGEKEAVDFYQLMRSVKTMKQVETDDGNDGDDDEEKQQPTQTDAKDTGEETSHEKRAVTYEIQKNRGLTPYRSKLVKTPHLNNRRKYKNAMRKHRSHVPLHKTEMERYSGEARGIRGSNVRSIKLS